MDDQVTTEDQPSLQETIQQYLNSDEIQSLSKSTQANYGYALQAFQIFCTIHRIKLPDTNQSLPGFAAYLRSDGKSGETIQQYVNTVKLFFRHIGTPVNYTYRIPSQQKKRLQLKKLNRWFDADDVERCLGYDFPDVVDIGIRVRNKLLVRMVAETGARIQEIAHVTFSDFDTSKGMAMLRYSKTEPRPAFYSDQSAILIERVLNDGRVSGKKMSDGVFPSVDQCKKIITQMLRTLGLKKDKDGRGPHTFRHYVATHLYFTGGMDLNDLAIVLGDKPETIRDNYLHPTPEMLRKRVAQAWGWR